MPIMKLSGILSFALVLAAAGCGSSGNGNQSADGGGTGGKLTGTGGVSGTGTGGSSGTGCGDTPACVTNLLTAGCLPAGTCVVQSDLTTFTANSCYSNGAKVITTIAASGDITVRLTKSGGATCLTEIVTSAADGGSGSFVIQNPGGATVATGTGNTDGTSTITCGGQTYNVTDMGSCKIDSSGCTDGTCQ
jgi:hypothetical protein